MVLKLISTSFLIKISSYFGNKSVWLMRYGDPTRPHFKVAHILRILWSCPQRTSPGFDDQAVIHIEGPQDPSLTYSISHNFCRPY